MPPQKRKRKDKSDSDDCEADTDDDMATEVTRAHWCLVSIVKTPGCQVPLDEMEREIEKAEQLLKPYRRARKKLKKQLAKIEALRRKIEPASPVKEEETW